MSMAVTGLSCACVGPPIVTAAASSIDNAMDNFLIMSIISLLRIERLTISAIAVSLTLAKLWI